jgi:4-hydroxy-tetrahydrodipicolinate reductase
VNPPESGGDVGGFSPEQRLHGGAEEEAMNSPDQAAKLRVFQVATGNVGSEMVRRVSSHPDLELVGLHAYSEDKVGRDAGELVGMDPIGVVATGSVEEIIAAAPDCVTFHGVFPDVGLYEQVLEAGINIVTTADWITGHHRDANHPHPSGRTESAILEDACQRGGSTFYGTGMNPGLAQILTIAHSADVADIEHVLCIESVDVSCHHSVDTWEEVGFGRPIDDPEVPGMLEKYTRVFEDAVRLMADCFRLELDEVRFEYELGACTEDVDLGWYHLPKGSLGGCYLRYVGISNGAHRVEMHLEWQMTPRTEPRWDIQGCYITKVQGDPCIYSKHMILPKPGTDFSSPDAFAAVGMTVTGLPALNAIRSVVEADPGCISSADLPLRAFAGRFKPDLAARA